MAERPDEAKEGMASRAESYISGCRQRKTVIYASDWVRVHLERASDHPSWTVCDHGCGLVLSVVGIRKREDRLQYRCIHDLGLELRRVYMRADGG